MTTLEKYYSDLTILNAESDELEAKAAEFEADENQINIDTLNSVYDKIDANFEAVCTLNHQLYLELKDRTELTDEESKMWIWLLKYSVYKVL